MLETTANWVLGVKIDGLFAFGRAIQLGFSAMGFDAEAFRHAAGPGGRDLALLTAYMAGVSQAAGHGAVLFLNRIPFLRFVLSLILMGLIYVAGAVVTAVSTTLAVEYAFGREVSYGPVIGVIALAHAPRLLGLLILAPHVGEAFSRFLDVWVFALILFGLHHGIGIPVGIAAMAALLGWLAIRLLWLLFGRPIGYLVTLARHGAAGAALTLTPQNVVEHLRARAGDMRRRREPGE
jgi:hypothetical protein